MIIFRRKQQDLIGDYLRSHAGAQLQVTANSDGLIVAAITTIDEYGDGYPAIGIEPTVRQALLTLSQELLTIS